MKLNITSKVLSLFVVVAALSFTACGDKDDDAQPSIGQTSCKITEVEDIDGDVSVVTYNANGYISSITESYTDGEEEYEYVVEYTYDNNNRLVKEEYFEFGESNEYITYEYANGLVSKRKYYYLGELDYTETMTYDSNKRLVKIEDNEDFVVNFTYNGNNLAKAETYYMDQLFYKSTYTNYDNKLTPFAAAKGMFLSYEGTSANNPGQVVYTYYFTEEPETYTVNYTYQYNNKNLPTQIAETDEDGEEDVTNFTYQCN